MENNLESIETEMQETTPPVKRGRPPKKELKLAKSASEFYNYSGNPWNPDSVDKMDSLSEKSFKKIVEACRFFYKHDALSSSVINKMVDIGINELIFSKQGLTDNEFRVFTALEQKLREFAENMALEYLISGLVIPEYHLAAVTKEDLKDLNIKKYDSLLLPTSMWLRDPATVTINKTFASAEPSYFIETDADTLRFIRTGGYFGDGTKDPVLFEQLNANFPDFVQKVIAGQTKFLLDSDNIIRRRYLSDSPYPIPFLYPAIEPLKHKRNLRRMDYSIASRVISAILLVKLGSDTFPVTEDDSGQFEAIKNQMVWRNSYQQDIERIFMLFGNHTLKLEWVFPDVNSLLNESKYKEVNQDIIFALGFPRILVTGESEKSNASDAQYATMSPIKTLNSFRDKILAVLRKLVSDIAKANNFKNAPGLIFKPLQLAEYATFVSAILKLYEQGNLSRESIDNYFGFNFKDEFDTRVTEEKLLKDSGLPEFSPTPNSRAPQNNVTTETEPTTKPKVTVVKTKENTTTKTNPEQ
jgi:hypothetical protein